MLSDRQFAPETLRPFLEPDGVAIVGASERRGSIGERVLRFLVDAGFRGGIYPVNPKHDELGGLQCFPSVREVPHPIDTVVVVVPANLVPGVIAQAVEASAKAAIIVSAGFAEIGPQGAKLQEEIADIASGSEIRLLGPNCVGLVNSTNGFTATFSTALDIVTPREGKMGLVTQSGAFGAYCITLFPWEQVGIKYWVSTGNEIDVDVSDWVQYMAGCPDIKVIGLYAENMKSAGKFIRSLEAATTSGKPIVLIKPGRSSEGVAAVKSHTASLTGSDLILDAVLAEYNVLRVANVQQFVEVLTEYTLADGPIGKRAGLISVSGGIGALMADSCAARGLEVPRLPREVREAIREKIPYAAVENPVDVTGQWVNEPGLLSFCVEQMANSGTVDFIVAFLGHAGQAEEVGLTVVEELGQLHKSLPLPLFISGSGEILRDRLGEMLRSPIYLDPDRTIEMIASLQRLRPKPLEPALVHSAAPELRSGAREAAADFISGLVVADANRRSLSEHETKTVLRFYGVSTPQEKIVQDYAEAVEAAKEIGFPVVLKVDSPDISHRMMHGLVFLNLRNERELRRACDMALGQVARQFPQARLKGLLLAEAVSPVAEVFVGLGTDPCFGPYITLSPGGVWVNLRARQGTSLLPLSRSKAMSLLSVAGIEATLSGGLQNWASLRESVVETILRIGLVADLLPSPISSLDVNPLALVRVADEVKVLALDAFAELVPTA